MTGTQMDRLLPAASITDISQQSTKWERLYESLARRQNQDGHRNAVCRFIKVAMAPGLPPKPPTTNDRHTGNIHQAPTRR
jgi:hypothetical protein